MLYFALQKVCFLFFYALLLIPFCLKSFGFPIIHLVTEDYPPLNIVEFNGNISGPATEVVLELLRTSHVTYTLDAYPWEKAYQMGLHHENTAVFSTARNLEREELFQWVGPIAQTDWSLFVMADGPIKPLSHLDEAKAYLVGGYKGDALSQYLKTQGFVADRNLDLAPNESFNALKLKEHRIDIWATSASLAAYLSKKEKTGPLKSIFRIKLVDQYLAFHKKVDKKLISLLNANLKTMNKNGTIQKIYDKYR